MRFHRYPACVLLGRSQVAAEAVDVERCRREGIEVVHRVTGGGAVYMSPRMLAWDVVLDRRAFAGDLGAATRRICEGVAAGLSRLGCSARFRPANDIEIGGLKVSGSSGYAEGRSVALQGTVLIEDDAGGDGPRVADAARLRCARASPAWRRCWALHLRSRRCRRWWSKAWRRRLDGLPCTQTRAPAISPRPKLSWAAR